MLMATNMYSESSISTVNWHSYHFDLQAGATEF